ncbi:hypothetical protein ABZX51_010090 [Aspergillus tubingensis]
MPGNWLQRGGLANASPPPCRMNCAPQSLAFTADCRLKFTDTCCFNLSQPPPPPLFIHNALDCTGLTWMGTVLLSRCWLHFYPLTYRLMQPCFFRASKKIKGIDERRMESASCESRQLRILFKPPVTNLSVQDESPTPPSKITRHPD